jgi:hypothetical protein
MKFGKALRALRKGKVIWREGWNDQEMWLELQKLDQDNPASQSYIYLIKPSSGNRIPWVVAQIDLLAEDWQCSI